MKKGQVIRQFRRLYDISQHEIAERIGVTQAAINKFEKNDPTDKRFEQIIFTLARLVVEKSEGERR